MGTKTIKKEPSWFPSVKFVVRLLFGCSWDLSRRICYFLCIVKSVLLLAIIIHNKLECFAACYQKFKQKLECFVACNNHTKLVCCTGNLKLFLTYPFYKNFMPVTILLEHFLLNISAMNWEFANESLILHKKKDIVRQIAV